MPKWINSKCNVCKKKVQKKAELCSSCRVVFEWVKNKYPDNTPAEWITLTRKTIIERKEKRLKIRNK